MAGLPEDMMPLSIPALRSSGRLAPLLCSALLACATRSAPRAFPPASAASPEAEPAPHRPVGVALDQHPPLPGDERAPWELWPGLERHVPDVPSHEGHH